MYWIRYLNASVFVASLGLAVSTYMIPIYAQYFGASYFDLGFLGLTRSLPYMIIPLVAGYFSDRFSRVFIYLIGIAINSSSMLALSFSNTLTHIYAAQILGGIGISLFWPIAETILSEINDSEKRIKAYSQYNISWSSAFLIGPFIGGVLTRFLNLKDLFMLSCFIISLSIVFVFMVSRGYRFLRASRSSGFSFNLSLTRIYFSIIPYSMVYASVVYIFPGYANLHGLSEFQVGVLFTVFGLARIISYYLIPYIVGFGSSRILSAMSMIMFGSMMFIGLFHETLTFIISLFLLGFSLGSFFPLTLNMISNRLSVRDLGFGVGLYESIFGFGFTVGPILNGLIADTLNPELSYVIIGFLALLIIPLVSMFKD